MTTPPHTPQLTTTAQERQAAVVMVNGIRNLLARCDDHEFLRRSMLRNYDTADYTPAEIKALLCEITIIAAQSIQPPF